LRSILLRLISVYSLLLLLFAIAAGQNSPSTEISKIFPKTLGDFRLQGLHPLNSLSKDIAPGDFGIKSVAEGMYAAPGKDEVAIVVVQTESQAGAYALLTRVAARMRSTGQLRVERLADVGIDGVAASPSTEAGGGYSRAVFYKGSTFVSITGQPTNSVVNSFADAYAKTLPDAGNEIPVLVKHLPGWERARDRAVYAVSLHGLQEAVGNQPSLDAVGFNQGTEAVTANYDASRLVIIEYATPQIAESNDARILDRVKQLRESNQPVPSAYRRVGNYSVFVFNAPDETASSQLIDNVKYEQRIQWLGENPFAFEAATQQRTQKAASLILSIAKTIGFFVALCLGAGGVVGGLAFLHRRARAVAAAENYSDAGGMLRLNLDEITPQTDPSRLLGSGEGETAIRS
jgi:hypothetical protein